MKIKYLIFLSLAFILGCNNVLHLQKKSIQNSTNLEIANKFIDAFYSFNRDSLKSILSNAENSQPSILYYQKWAECGNYKIAKKNNFIKKNDTTIICPITVKDDLIGALEIDFNVTDSFHLTITDGHIISVQTSSNDPKEYYEAREWIIENHPELIEEPCIGIWEGGPTPCECVRAMVKGYSEFTSSKKQKQ
uniref:hypothetical protein n=1 Tax=uncultured Draconibacterium sp. TaxID=1573823 RepID=UPI003216DD4D